MYFVIISSPSRLLLRGTEEAENIAKWGIVQVYWGNQPYNLGLSMSVRFKHLAGGYIIFMDSLMSGLNG